MPTVKKEYKDRLFSFIFGNEENKAWTLSLYNAVNNSEYKNPDDIQIKTIRETLYLGMHNDVSFLISNEMNVYEQQSTYNPNMPLRQMQYAGNMYERYIKENGLNKYGSVVLKLPVPKLITFYNGTKEQPDEQFLHLSDSFPEGAKPDIEVTVRMLNVNYDHNKELLDACKPLQEYAWLIQTVRNNMNHMDKDEALNAAISDLPDDFIIKPFLDAHRSEVYGMLLTEYNESEAMELFKKDGKEETLVENIKKLMKNMKMTAEQAMSILEIPLSDQAKYISKL